MIKILCISGPTASGKTGLSVELAKRLGGEIVSCDSMQIYKGMDIGTAKPTLSEMDGIPHYMIDVVSPDENYSCADYTNDAEKAILEINKRNKLPIICGGTGLYLESLLYQNSFEAPGADEKIRSTLVQRSPEENYSELSRVDPESAKAIHPNNIKRVIRALEIYYVSGKTKTELDKLSRKEKKYDSRIYVLTSSDRDFLYKRINERVDMMIEAGLVDEVKRLGLSKDSTAGEAIGYKEISEYLEGRRSLDSAIEEVKKASRNYAKRQITWWERNKEAIKIDISKYSKDEIADLIVGQTENF